MSAGKEFSRFFVVSAISFALTATNNLWAQRYDPVGPTAPIPDSTVANLDGWMMPAYLAIVIVVLLIVIWAVKKFRARKSEDVIRVVPATDHEPEPPKKTPPIINVTPEPPPPPPVVLPPTVKPEVRSVKVYIPKPITGSGYRQTLRADVEVVGGATSSVTWSANHSDVVNRQGVFFAPDVNESTDITITATSVFDPTKSGSGTLTVVPRRPLPPPSEGIDDRTKKIFPQAPLTPTDPPAPTVPDNPPAPPVPTPELPPAPSSPKDPTPIPNPPTEGSAPETGDANSDKKNIDLVPPEVQDRVKRIQKNVGKAGRGATAAALLVLALSASRAVAAECGDGKYGMPFFATAGQTERVECLGLSDVKSVSFTDVKTGNVIAGIHISNLSNGGSFDITVDRSVPPSRPNMIVNGVNIGRPLRFFPPDQAGIVDATTEIMRDQLGSLRDQITALQIRINSLPAPKPAANTTTVTKVEVDQQTRAQVADLEGKIRSLQAQINKVQPGDELTYADFRKMVDANPATFRELIAAFAPPPPAPVAVSPTSTAPSFTKDEVLREASAEAHSYTDRQVSVVESEVRPVVARVNKVEADLLPTGETGRKIARTDKAAQALLEDKLKPKGTSKSSRKAELKAAWSGYSVYPTTSPSAQLKKK